MDAKLARRALIARSRTDFYTFMVMAFGEIDARPFIRSDHARGLAWKLQSLEGSAASRTLVAAPPRHFKTYIISVAYPAWLLGRDPSRRIVCASYNAEFADSLGTQTRKIMQSDLYKRIFPDTKLTSTTPAAGNLETTAGGGRFATSISGTLTGKGADVILVDDPIKAQDGDSAAVRKAVWEWLNATALTRFDSPKTSIAIVTHQRLHLDDPIGRLKVEGGWDCIELPAIIQTPLTLRLAPSEARFYDAGDILLPERFDVEWLEKQKEAMGEGAFAAQYLQRPLPPGGGLFKMANIKRFELPPKILKQDFEALILSVDTGISTNPDADFTALTLWGVRGEQVYLCNVEQGRWDLPTQIKRVGGYHGRVDAILIEKSQPGIALSQMLAKEGVDRQVGFTPRGDKQLRAQTAALAVERKRVNFPLEAPWLGLMEQQLAEFPYAANDDLVDTMSQLFCSLELGLPHFVELGFYKPKLPQVNAYVLGGSKIQQLGLKSY